MRITFIILSVLVSTSLVAQPMSASEAVSFALKNNAGMKAASHSVDAQNQLKKTGFDLPKTDVTIMRGQYNGYPRNDNNISVVQTVPFTAFGSQSSLNKTLLASLQLGKAKTGNMLIYQVQQVYHQLLYAHSRRKLLLRQDSIFEGFYRSASLRYKSGETNLLEQTMAEAQRDESKNRVFDVESDIVVLRNHLQALLNSNTLPDVSGEELIELPLTIDLDSGSISNNPALAYSRQQVEVAFGEKKLASARFAPDLLVGYFNQTLIGVADMESARVASSKDRFSGFQLGLSIPLWFAPHQGRVKAADYSMKAAQGSYENERTQMRASFHSAIQQYERTKQRLSYYRTTALPTAELMIKQSKLAFGAGEAGYSEYLLGIRSAVSMQENYLSTLNELNQSIITLEFLAGKK